MVSEPFLCWWSFYAINEPALSCAHGAVLSTGPSLYLLLLSILTPSYSSAALGTYLHGCPRPSPSSVEASSPWNLSSATSTIKICLASATASFVPHHPVLLLSPCCIIHVVEFSLALPPLFSFILQHNSSNRVLESPSTSVLVHYARVIGDRLCPAWRFSPHLVSFIDIQFSFVDSSSYMHTSPVIASTLCSRYAISSQSRSPKCWFLISFT